MNNKDGDDKNINKKYIPGAYYVWNTILNTLYLHGLIHLIFTAACKVDTTIILIE